jgi:5-methylcytosine-specific restriction endonuclease McrA
MESILVVNFNQHLCSYGCGNKAKYKLKNGKLCCSEFHSMCPALKEKNRQGNKGKKYSIETKKLMRKIKLAEKNPMYGKKNTKKQKEAVSLTIRKIKNKYSFFSQIEELRYNPDKPEEKEIQVHCKNHNCPNSKEQNGWFTPTYIQLYERIRQLENECGNGGCYFYCCDKCKNECPLYNLRSDPFKLSEEYYTQNEYQQFREYVLERDDYKCQYCGEKAEHVHHERPQKLEPFHSLDPDLAWSVCKKCHYKYGHRDECSTVNIASIIC